MDIIEDQISTIVSKQSSSLRIQKKKTEIIKMKGKMIF